MTFLENYLLLRVRVRKLLRFLINFTLYILFSEQIHELKTSFNKSVTNILAETEVSRPLSTRSTLKVNKESAASMVEIMKEANNIFSTVRDHKTNILNKVIANNIVLF